jgi:hypothetical protein
VKKPHSYPRTPPTPLRGERWGERSSMSQGFKGFKRNNGKNGKERKNRKERFFSSDNS